MGLSPQENANLTVKSEIQDSYGPVSSSGISWIKQEIEMEGNSPEYVDVSVNSEELDLYQRESVCDLPFIKEEPEVWLLAYAKYPPSLLNVIVSKEMFTALVFVGRITKSVQQG
nr:unnamed protein product [Timema tahoe]